MVIIISQEGDTTSDLVMNWILKFDVPVLRINETDLILNSKMSLNNDAVEYYLFKKRLDPNKITSVWFRRDTNNYSVDSEFSTQIQDEFTIYKQQFHNWLCQFEHIKILGYSKLSNLNRLSVLTYAQSIGIQIPNTLITRQKTELNSFIKKYKKVMTKPLDEVHSIITENHHITFSPKLLTSTDVESVDNQFGLSCFQEYIDKAFEIRTLFIDDKFYSMAIFSQENEKTKIDYRNYDDEFPNRMEPYNLPNEQCQLVRKLMSVLNFNMGVIDFMIDTKGKFYFLEVNPHGQFGFIENHCNYQLYKIIAQKLIG